MQMKPPRRVVWSTNVVDLSDPFQRKWYIQQVLCHGRAEDIRTLNLSEVAQYHKEARRLCLGITSAAPP